MGPFWEAEPEHQDYLERIPWGYTPLPAAELEAPPGRHDRLTRPSSGSSVGRRGD